MAIYEYQCDQDGLFDKTMPLGTAPHDSRHSAGRGLFVRRGRHPERVLNDLHPQVDLRFRHSTVGDRQPAPGEAGHASRALGELTRTLARAAKALQVR